jgi:hypothetical protein
VLATSPAPPTLGDRATGDGVLSLHLRRSAPAHPYKIEWVSIPELAERIGMAKESVYRLARAGQFPGAVKMAGATQ